MPKVLLIENNRQIIDDISFCLDIGFSGATVIPVDDVNKVMETIKMEIPGLVILDSTLFLSNCPETIIKIREHSNAPLLILSDRETDMDRARGLEAGADEYIYKPFNPMELLATCRALFRRSNHYSFSTRHAISIGRITADFDTREISFSGKTVKLTPIEFRLFSELIRNEGQTLTHRTILENVWGHEYTGDNGFVKKYIYRLRTKLQYANHQQLIRSIRGTGYKLCHQDEVNFYQPHHEG
jgi:DNA-binding response OmpR family regulator